MQSQIPAWPVSRKKGRESDCQHQCVVVSSECFKQRVFSKGKYTNPARGILDFSKQKLYRPLSPGAGGDIAQTVPPLWY